MPIIDNEIDPNAGVPYESIPPTANQFTSEFAGEPVSILDKFGGYGSLSTEVSYGKRQGLLQVPIGATSGECEIVRIHQPISVKIVTWSASRKKYPPRVPAPESLDANNVLLEVSIGHPVPFLAADGIDHTYVLAGTYTYAMKTPLDTTKALVSGVLSNDKTLPTANRIPATVFDATLMDDGSGLA